MTTPINNASAPNAATQVVPQDAQTSTSTDAGRQTVAAGSTADGTISRTGAPVQVVQEAQRQSAQPLADATRDFSEYIQSVSRSLNISVDRDLGTTVIQVLDAETEELVRQIPAEEILQIARFLSDQQANSAEDASMRGLLLDQEG